MPKFSPEDYQPYLKSRLNIITQRSLLCQQIMDPLPPYDYWTYNFAYYLYSLNAEELNYLRYLFGSKTTQFYEFTTLGHMRKYLQEINWHGVPKHRDFSRSLGAPYLINNRQFYILAPNFGLPVVIPPTIPPAFKGVEESLQTLTEQLITLADDYPSLHIKPFKHFSHA